MRYMGLSLREIFFEAKKVLTRESLKVFKASHNTFFGRLGSDPFFELLCYRQQLGS